MTSPVGDVARGGVGVARTAAVLVLLLVGPWAPVAIVAAEGRSTAPAAAYVSDDFEAPAHSRRVWYFASCTDTPHATKDAPAKYPTFGMAVRPGYCGFHGETLPNGNSNHFMRFTTMPFDRRDARVVFDRDKAVVADDFDRTVDVRKGGSEMRGRTSAYVFGPADPHGWDPKGENYLRPTDTVRFSWRFRLSDVGMIRAGTRGEALASRAVVGQFHSQNDRACNPEDAYDPNFSPAPGLDVAVVGATATTPEEIVFTLFTKLRNAQIPAGVPTCGGDPNAMCKVDLWQASFPSDRVTRTGSADQRVPPWITVGYDLRFARSGTLEFRFGVEGSRDRALAYRVRPLLGHRRLALPTTQNACPNLPFLGAYVLGYNRRYYGYESAEAYLASRKTPLPESEVANIRADHRPHPSVWVNPSIAEDPDFRKYIDGTWTAPDHPPQLVVDYDDFQVRRVEPTGPRGRRAGAGLRPNP